VADFLAPALARLTPEERTRERKGGGIPRPLSLHSIGGRFLGAVSRMGLLGEFTGERPVVVAVSGGGDSTALLWLMRVFCTCPIVAAHLEHGIRPPSASLADARFVEEMAARWGAGFEMRSVSVPSALRRGESLEAGARRLRHEFLSETAARVGAWGVALGHNRDDLAETALFNLLRGTGVRGMSGMPERRGLFFRPLLGFSRALLRDVLRCRGIPWREDSTNEDAAFNSSRNFIRNTLMPLIESRLNSRAVDHLADFALEMSEAREEEEQTGARLLAQLLRPPCRLPRDGVRKLGARETAVLIRAVGRRLGLPTLSRQRCEALARLMAGAGRFTFQWCGSATVEGRTDFIKWTLSALDKPSEQE
jgi:tRNA(Ile)-lysidine synthase